MNPIKAFLSVAVLATAVLSQNGAEKTADGGGGFRIDEPGTITFTVAMKIEGKIDKPQVMIFLPKEKRYYRKITFSHSFHKEIMSPFPFTPEPD
jgi:hypothetical protein